MFVNTDNMDKASAAEVIESNRPLIGLAGYFRNGVDALWYYAGDMRNRFQRDQVGPQCFICERAAVSQVQMFYWLAKVHPRFIFTILDALMLLCGWLRFKINHPIVSFPTAHGFCDSCASKAKQNRAYSAVIKSISFVILFFCIGMTIVSCGAAIIMRANPNDRNLWLVITFVGVIGLLVSTFGHIWARRLRIPARLRRIGADHFTWQKSWILMPVTQVELCLLAWLRLKNHLRCSALA